jgi:hypothetical protein
MVQNAGGGHLHRIIHQSIEKGYYLFNIDLYYASLPTLYSQNYLLDLYSQHKIAIAEDPYVWLTSPYSRFSKKQLEVRDSRKLQMQHLLEFKDLLFDSDTRGQVFRTIEHDFHIPPKTAYKLLRYYWRGGQIENALMGNYQECGRRKDGKPKIYSDDDGKKVGALSNHTINTGEPTGVNLTPEIKQIFELGTNQFYLNPENRKKDKKDAFEFIKRKYLRIEENENEIILSKDKHQPQIYQYYRWFRLNYLKNEIIKLRQGQNYYETHVRPLLGSNWLNAFRPGRMVQIDATIADIYLRSGLLGRGRIIGRPVIYFIRDVFTDMIVGIAVMLEGPSWKTGSLAVASIYENKVDLCNEYNIKILPDQWPAVFSPSYLLADNGEFKGLKSDTLISTMGITVINVPPFRPDWKGLIERYFRIINDEVLKFVPGFVFDEKFFRARDYRLDACLTLDEFVTILLDFVVTYNNNFYLSNFSPDYYMIKESVNPVPVDIWRWGISNYGNPGHKPFETAVLNLYETGNGSLTREGLEFHGAHYASEFTNSQGWYEHIKGEPYQPKQVLYNPYRRNPKLYVPDGGKLLTLDLTDRDSNRFKSSNLYEITDYEAVKKNQGQALIDNQDAAMANFGLRMENMVQTAVADTKEADKNSSNRSLTQGIGSNRQSEKLMHHEGPSRPGVSSGNSAPNSYFSNDDSDGLLNQ